MHRRLLLHCLQFLALVTMACAAEDGAVTGVIVARESNRPVEYAMVVVKQARNGKAVQSGATDAKGVFDLTGLPWGEYKLVYGLVGAVRTETDSFTIDLQHRSVDLGRRMLDAGEVVRLEKVEVLARQEAFYGSIDRRIYNVGRDLQSAAGSASDLLQNVPSVQVDIEGNVSLRGGGNVLILINGKTSALMGKNRAAVLEQMPAEGIERIEVVTNPSAKYKPDGTAGIINLVLRKNVATGSFGTVRGAAGNDGRFSASVSANYPLGKCDLFASAAVRKDDRPRTVQDNRSHLDAATHSVVSTSQFTVEHSRPLSRIAQTGVDYKPADRTKLGGDIRYNFRDFRRDSSVGNLARNAAGATTGDYDRLRLDLEWEKVLEFTGKFHHSFVEEDREFNLEIRHGKTTEQEDNRYTNVFRTPVRSKSFDFTLIRNTETNTEASAHYVHPLGETSKLEGGYDGQFSEIDLDFRGSFTDATGAARIDAARTNHFIYAAAIHALYGTFARKLGSFGLLVGLRFEHAEIDTNQVTAHLLSSNVYKRFYPSLHLSYDLTGSQQLQLNYSHRVHRPEGDDLNPYPEYQDPFNLRAGNPKLVPEDIHSFEGGWQYKHGDTTYLATAYYRQRYHGITDVARYIDSTTLLTTKANLGASRSGGFELGANTRLRDRLALNFSANVYHNEIDASNLGFSARRSTFAWDAKVNASFDLTKTTLVQLSTSYTAKRLSPQGYRYPTHLANLGLRQNLADKKTFVVFTVSDMLNTLRERTHIDTPVLRQDITRRRSSRIVYVGLVYNFGKSANKPKKDDIQFENVL